jgi:hypothetical protein
MKDLEEPQGLGGEPCATLNFAELIMDAPLLHGLRSTARRTLNIADRVAYMADPAMYAPPGFTGSKEPLRVAYATLSANSSQ